MASSTLGPKLWQDLVKLWQDEGQTLITCPAEGIASLLQTQSVKQLLAKTRELMLPVLTAKGGQLERATAGAVSSGAVTLLAKLLHQLQQDPSLQVISVDSQRPCMSAWYCVLQALCAILEVMRGKLEDYYPGLLAHVIICRDQLVEAEGAKQCQTYAAIACWQVFLSLCLPWCMCSASMHACLK